MNDGFVVSPRSTEAIYKTAAQVREVFAGMMPNARWVPIDKIYETLHLFVEGFELQICDHREMGDDHGLTFPEDRLIKLRTDVYDGMCTGVGRDRFTAAHELGHLFLHNTPGLARRRTEISTPAYKNSEWQANTFASALLIDGMQLAQCRSAHEVAETFGVSIQAANVRYKK